MVVQNVSCENIASKKAAMSVGFLVPVNEIDVHQLASIIRNKIENVLIIDSRSFTDHNACHITSAVNVGCSKIVKRRLQQDKLSVKELLIHTCSCDVDEKLDVVVYDQSSKDTLSADSFIVVLLKKLQLTFRSINLLTGGFEEFHKHYPDLCEDKTRKCPPLTSLSQPCLPITNQGPTRILPFLYLGSQFDAVNKDLLKDYNINYELNVSTTCPQPDFLPEGHFMRIPVNDTYNEKLLPYFPQAFNFLDKVREGNGCVLVHCLAGISRSPTVAIAYVMRHLHLSSDDGYRYVKSKRPTISPNFNFLGQLLEYEKQLRKENILEPKPEQRSAPPVCSKKRVCRTDMRQLALPLEFDFDEQTNPNLLLQPKKDDQSPTTALAKLSFDVQQVPKSEESSQSLPDFRQYRSKSCYGDWLRLHEESPTDKKIRDNGPVKVLSPVKEIKCDALISDISVGNCEPTVKFKGTTRQRMTFSQYSKGERSSSQKTCNNKFENPSNINKEQFSLVTLTHMFSSSNKKAKELHNSEKSSYRKMKGSFSFDLGNHNTRYMQKEASNFPQSNNKRTCHSSLVKSSENLPKTEDLEQKPDCHEHLLYHKIPFFHHSLSLNSDLHKLSDSSELTTLKTENYPTKRNLEQWTDNINSRQTPLPSKDYNLNLTFYSRLNSTNNNWPKISSRIQNDYQFVESKDKINSSTDLFNSVDSSDEPNNLQDSLFTSVIGPRKRVACFDSNSIELGSDSPTKDKRKYKPFNNSFAPTFIKDRTISLVDSGECSTAQVFSQFDSYHSVNDNKNGLYRAQSCPVILYHAPSFFNCDTKEFSFKKKFSKNQCSPSTYFNRPYKDIISHESCPDVLNLKENDNLVTLTHRQREFRRHVKMIQVS